MKREGRQHGMVRTYPIVPSPWNPRPKAKARVLQQLDSPPTAGLFTKVSTKPTNHSKFTGNCGKPRCSGCRAHPVGKANNKTKGSFKHKSRDVFVDCPLLAWRFVDDDCDKQWMEIADSEYESESMVERGYSVNDFGDDDEDHEMSYCHVESFVDQEAMVSVGDEMWCLVEVEDI